MDALSTVDLRLAAYHRDRLRRTDARALFAADANIGGELRERRQYAPDDEVDGLADRPAAEDVEKYGIKAGEVITREMADNLEADEEID